MRKTRFDMAQYDVFNVKGGFICTVSFAHGTTCKDVKFSLIRYYKYAEDIKVLKHKEK